MATTNTSKVKAAARWLDSVKPGWAYLVNMSKLDLDDTKKCVCGQAFAAEAQRTDNYNLSGYGFACELDGYDPHDEVFCDFVEPRGGRSAGSVAVERATRRSHELWKDEIRARRGKSGTRGNR